MSGLLWSLVGKRVLAESARNHFGTEVSLYSAYTSLVLLQPPLFARRFCEKVKLELMVLMKNCRTRISKKSQPHVWVKLWAKRRKGVAKRFRLD